MFPIREMPTRLLLAQHVMQPTHKRGDQQANILDLILTNDDTIEAPHGKRHHCSLVFKLRCYAEYKSSNVKNTFKYAKGDYDKNTTSKMRPECGRYLEEANGRGLVILRRNYQNGHELKHTKVKP